MESTGRTHIGIPVGVWPARGSLHRDSSLTLPNGIVAQYTHDNANQLTATQYTSGSNPLGDLTYAYDTAGRRVERGGSLSAVSLPAAVSSATYDANQRLLTWGARSLSYDSNGNMTSDGVAAYTWDSRNRMVSTNGATFSYDGMGRRTGKNTSGGTISYLYDDQNVAQELTGSGVLANFLNGLDYDERYSRTDGGGRRTYITDAIGSVLALTDDAGTVQSAYIYEPYGLTSASGSSSSNSNQFTGRENDGTELYHYRSRYYNPIFGRFVSEDPLGLAGGLNVYEYVLGNPTRYTDPLGEEPEDPSQPRRYSRRSPTIKCVICGKHHGGVKGTYCWDCDTKSRDPKEQIPPNPYNPDADNGDSGDGGDGNDGSGESGNANRMFDPFGYSQQMGFLIYHILFPCW